MRSNTRGTGLLVTDYVMCGGKVFTLGAGLYVRGGAICQVSLFPHAAIRPAALEIIQLVFTTKYHRPNVKRWIIGLSTCPCLLLAPRVFPGHPVEWVHYLEEVWSPPEARSPAPLTQEASRPGHLTNRSPDQHPVLSRYVWV